MATIYEKTPGGLIAAPGRTIATFPSGLCRVDQKYVCTTANAATHRAALAIGNDMPDGNEAPAIDGLKIFPTPQETERGDGFTEFSVSAYGRTSREMTNVELVRKNIEPSFNQSFLSSVSFWEIKGKIALPYGTSLDFNDLNLDPTLLLPFDAVYYGSGKTLLSVNAGEKSTFYQRQPDITYVAFTGRRYYLIFTNDGITPSDSWNVYIEDPVFVISSQQSFGSFVEVDVITKRGNTQEITSI